MSSPVVKSTPNSNLCSNCGYYVRQKDSEYCRSCAYSVKIFEALEAAKAANPPHGLVACWRCGCVDNLYWLATISKYECCECGNAEICPGYVPAFQKESEQND